MKASTRAEQTGGAGFACVSVQWLKGDCRCGTALHALAVHSVSALTLEAARFAEADSQALVSSCMQALGCLLL
jgi:hypothetical protein